MLALCWVIALCGLALAWFTAIVAAHSTYALQIVRAGRGPRGYETQFRPEDIGFRVLFAVGCAAVAWIAGSLSVVVMAHRRKLAHFLTLTSLIAAAHVVVLAWGCWRWPGAIAWMLAFVGGNGLVAIVALGLGVAFGRPLFRLSARFILPSEQRMHLGYLWRIDGLATPSEPATHEPPDAQ